ncbi:MAG TPA: SulP family inorganic anion transporter [Acetobacteraceae bacterium]|nr:SulP family inorganic anion transporter [Acetobacteraceae bacterium]
MPEAAARPGLLFASLRGFRFSWLPGDAIAGLTLAAIAIPEQLATARLLGMPPVSGLFAFAAGTIAFAAFGTNRFVSVGADSTIAPIMAATLASLAAIGSPHYAEAAAVLALLTGLVLLLTRPLRLGWIADLLSIPVATGFLAGISIHIIIGQLPTILGVAAPDGALLDRLGAIVRMLPRTNPYPLAIAAGVLAVSMAGELINARLPGALIGLAGSACAVWGLALQHHGVPVLGPLPFAIPTPAFALPDLNLLLRLLPLSLIVALVCMVQTAVVLQSFPSDRDHPGDASRNFLAVGAGSILAALLGGFAVNASPPRTAVVAESGGRSQFAGLLALGFVAALVLLGARAFAFVPYAALSGVLVFIALRIFRLATMRQIYRRSREETLLVAASAALVVVLPIETGVSMSIVLSLLHSLYIIARPRCAELTRVPGSTVWWTLGPGEAGEHVPGVLVFGFGAPIAFINANYLVERLSQALQAAPAPVRLVVIEAHGVLDVDFTGSLILQQAIVQARRNGIDVAIARLESMRAMQAAERTGLLAVLGPDHVFRSVEEAINAIVTPGTMQLPGNGRVDRPAAGRRDARDLGARHT